MLKKHFIDILTRNDNSKNAYQFMMHKNIDFSTILNRNLTDTFKDSDM